MIDLQRETSRQFRITRVQLRHYRSIAACDVALGRMTLLVGANGSGKSNFLDSLRLVSDALQSTLDHAIRDRGGIAVLRKFDAGRRVIRPTSESASTSCTPMEMDHIVSEWRR